MVIKMTCGIYLLRFTGLDKVYIGQSLNIEQRYRKHLQFLRNQDTKANYKMKAAYLLYGVPQLEILCECKQHELNRFEAEAFELYDIAKNGLNIAKEPDIHLAGTKNPASKYSEEQILSVLQQLAIGAQYKDIHSSTSVSISTIRHIANQEAHGYLNDLYPELYESMLSFGTNGNRMQVSCGAGARGITYPPILSPDGKEYIVTHVANFAREHGLDASCLAKVLKRTPKYNSHKGWKLKI